MVGRSEQRLFAPDRSRTATKRRTSDRSAADSSRCMPADFWSALRCP